MTASKQSVAGQQPGNPQKGTKKQTTTSSRTRKPAALKAQAKSTPAKSPAKTTASPGRTGGSVSTLKANATRAEALEHENVAVQNKKTSGFATNPTDVAGVVVPSDNQEIKQTPTVSPITAEEDKKHHHKKDKDKHHPKDRIAHLLPTNDEMERDKDHATTDPKKQLETLQKKALKSEKKVQKLKKKVHKAEKKDIKPSKIRALKEKLTKAFSKWQRRKKKVEEADKMTS